MGEKDYDPVMHTAEHLVNGTIARMLGCGRAFSTHIEKKKSKCDFRFPRNLTPEELERVEQTVNSQIAAKLGVRDELLSPDEAGAAAGRGRIGPYRAYRRLRRMSVHRQPCSQHGRNTSRIHHFERLHRRGAACPL